MKGHSTAMMRWSIILSLYTLCFSAAFASSSPSPSYFHRTLITTPLVRLPISLDDHASTYAQTNRWQSLSITSASPTTSTAPPSSSPLARLSALPESLITWTRDKDATTVSDTLLTRTHQTQAMEAALARDIARRHARLHAQQHSRTTTTLSTDTHDTTNPLNVNQAGSYLGDDSEADQWILPPADVSVDIQVNGQPYTLQLFRHDGLTSHNYKATALTSTSASSDSYSLPLSPSDRCHYSGNVYQHTIQSSSSPSPSSSSPSLPSDAPIAVGKAGVSLCDGSVTGVFGIQGVLHYIEPLSQQSPSHNTPTSPTSPFSPLRTVTTQSTPNFSSAPSSSTSSSFPAFSLQVSKAGLRSLSTHIPPPTSSRTTTTLASRTDTTSSSSSSPSSPPPSPRRDHYESIPHIVGVVRTTMQAFGLDPTAHPHPSSSSTSSSPSSSSPSTPSTSSPSSSSSSSTSLSLPDSVFTTFCGTHPPNNTTSTASGSSPSPTTSTTASISASSSPLLLNPSSSGSPSPSTPLDTFLANVGRTPRTPSRRRPTGRVLTDMTTTKFAELQVVNDYQRFVQQGSLVATTRATATIVNIVDTLYNMGNFVPPLRIILVGQTTFTTNAPPPYNFATEMSGGKILVSDIAAALGAFATWAGEEFADVSDTRSLFSGLTFKANVLGVAAVGRMCVPEASSMIQAVSSFSIPFLGTVVAHELGHNFNMLHDNEVEYVQDSGIKVPCPKSGTIMGSSASTTITEWSQCSRLFYKQFLQQYPGVQACLENVPTHPYTEGVCGNGIVEPGETCDCGGNTATSCDGIDDCCDGRTCRLKTGATYRCSNAQPCCVDCMYRSASENHLCRALKHHFCDYEERCDGKSGACPTDTFRAAGTGCTTTTSFAGKCYKGTCQTFSGFCPLYNSSSVCNGQTPAEICSQIRCAHSSNPDSCFVPTNSSSIVIPTPDGTSCASDSQCVAGACVLSSSIDSGGYQPSPDGGLDTFTTVLIVGSICLVTVLGFIYCMYKKFCGVPPHLDQHIGVYAGNQQGRIRGGNASVYDDAAAAGGAGGGGGAGVGAGYPASVNRAQLQGPGGQYMNEDLQMSMALQLSAEEARRQNQPHSPSSPPAGPQVGVSYPQLQQGSRSGSGSGSGSASGGENGDNDIRDEQARARLHYYQQQQQQRIMGDGAPIEMTMYSPTSPHPQPQSSPRSPPTSGNPANLAGLSSTRSTGSSRPFVAASIDRSVGTTHSPEDDDLAIALAISKHEAEVARRRQSQESPDQSQGGSIMVHPVRVQVSSPRSSPSGSNDPSAPGGLSSSGSSGSRGGTSSSSGHGTTGLAPETTDERRARANAALQAYLVQQEKDDAARRQRSALQHAAGGPDMSSTGQSSSSSKKSKKMTRSEKAAAREELEFEIAKRLSLDEMKRVQERTAQGDDVPPVSKHGGGDGESGYGGGNAGCTPLVILSPAAPGGADESKLRPSSVVSSSRTLSTPSVADGRSSRSTSKLPLVAPGTPSQDDMRSSQVSLRLDESEQ